MRQLLEHIWNNGNPLEIEIREMRQREWMSAYGNHRKLSYEPWSLLENGLSSRHRKLTEQGAQFVQGNIRIPFQMIKDPSTWEWIADPEADMILITDLDR